MKIPPNSIIIFDEDDPDAPPRNSKGGRSSIPNGTRIKRVIRNPKRVKAKKAFFYCCEKKALLAGSIFWVTVSILIEWFF